MGKRRKNQETDIDDAATSVRLQAAVLENRDQRGAFISRALPWSQGHQILIVSQQVFPCIALSYLFSEGCLRSRGGLTLWEGRVW